MNAIEILLSSLLALVVLALLFTPNRSETKSQETVDKEIYDDIMTYTKYVIDPRTNICLLSSKTYNDYYVYTPVECTESVMNNVVNKQK